MPPLWRASLELNKILISFQAAVQTQLFIHLRADLSTVFSVDRQTNQCKLLLHGDHTLLCLLAPLQISQ